jgi:hypothetical protein
MADNNTRDTIYVDIDDEITALIDKVRQSSGKLVALVLPKRATVLQSIVNMKLLKRVTESEKKSIVLITTEAGLLPLAGAVGVYVAKTLESKPEIPISPDLSLRSQIPETINEDMSLPLSDSEEIPDLTKQAGKAASVGALAAAAHQPLPPRLSDESVETVELDNEDKRLSEEELAAAAMGSTKSAKKLKKDKNLKVPNFERFRLLLIIGIIVIIALIVLGILAFDVLPHAVIDVKTNASNVNANLNLTLDPQAQSVNASTGDIPASQVSQQKTFTQTINTTGQQNEGSTATGQVTFVNCSGGPLTIPQGTTLSYNNLTYITQADASMSGSTTNNGLCVDYTHHDRSTVAITAQNPGSSYNQGDASSPVTFTVNGYYGTQATGSASGGTNNMVQTVAQADIATATAKINAIGSGNIKQSLMNQLRGQGLYPIGVTFSSSTPQIAANPTVGTASSTVTVTETVTYTLYGASKSDIVKLLNANILSQTGKNQNIMSDGLSSNDFKQVGTNGSTDQVSLSALAEVGPNISAKQIKKQAAGKSPQAIISFIKNNPDVTSVTVRLSPFWVSSAPTNSAKITVQLAKPTKSV